MITSLVLKAKASPNKCKKERYSIGNFSKKDLSKIIRELDKNLMKVMRRRGPNMILLIATLPSNQLAKCTMITVFEYTENSYTSTAVLVEVFSLYSNKNTLN